MVKKHILAVDMMGGDYAPKEIINGILLARDKYNNLFFNCYGDQKQILSIIGGRSKKNLKIINTTETIEMGEEPVRAIRKKKDSSLVRAANSVKNGESDALFSAGNTGALLVCGIFIIGRLKGIQRPGLLTTLPSVKKRNRDWVLMDVGANAEVKPSYLYQFGVIGNFYAKNILNRNNPEIKLLNNGIEEDKGDKTHIKAHQLLKKSELLNFTGNIESRYLLEGKTDVVVSDGFSGNTALKAIEGTALSLFSGLKETLSNSGVFTKVGALLVKPAIKNFSNILNYNKYGGALIAGLNAPVVKTHGSAKALAVSNTVEQIKKILENNLIGKIREYIKRNPNEFIKGDKNNEKK